MGSCVFVRCPAGPCGVQPAERVLSAGSADALFCSMPARASPKSQPPLGTGHADSLLGARELEGWGRPPIDYRASREESTAGNSPVPRVDRSRSLAFAVETVEMYPSMDALLKFLVAHRRGDILIYQATKFALLINLTAANAIGFAIPSSLLARADEGHSRRCQTPQGCRHSGVDHSTAVWETIVRPPGDPSGRGRSVPHRLPSGC